MFLILLFAMVVMVLVIALLPQFTGLVKYTNNPDYIEKKRKKELLREEKLKESQKNNYDNNNNTGYYQEPDQYIDDETEGITSSSKTSKFSIRSKLNNLAHTQITEKDIPIKLELTGESELKRRVRGKNTNSIPISEVLKANPNNYDYDIDEFIEEENNNEVLEEQQDAERKYGTYTV